MSRYKQYLIGGGKVVQKFEILTESPEEYAFNILGRDACIMVDKNQIRNGLALKNLDTGEITKFERLDVPICIGCE